MRIAAVAGVELVRGARPVASGRSPSGVGRRISRKGTRAQHCMRNNSNKTHATHATRAHNTRNTHNAHTRNSSTGKRDILLRTGIYLTPALSFRRRRRPVISGWIGFGIGFGKPPFIVVPAAVAKNHPRNRVPQLLAAPKTCRGTQNNANAPV